MKTFARTRIVLLTAGLMLLPARADAQKADDLSPEKVRTSIRHAQQFLKSRQNADGTFRAALGGHTVGVTSLALLSMMNSGLTPDDPAVSKGLKYLRNVELPSQTYDISLMLMALAAAKDGTDNFRMQQLVNLLESGQITAGRGTGGWSYRCGKGNAGLGRPDRSNSQFAVLGLRDAVYAGLSVKRSTWQRVKQYWENGQGADGGWSYVSRNSPSTGSMTVAGIAALVIVNRMLNEKKDVNPDGTPICCREEEPYKPLQRGIAWLSGRVDAQRTVTRNAGKGTNTLYYLYGLERAGRLSGRRFFGKHDWYREGVHYLVFGNGRQARDGSWTGNGFGEKDPVVATSMALLFLSKGLAPVLINKLKYGPPDERDPDEVANNNWNRHKNDVRNITEYISTRDDWPQLLTWQTVEMRKMIRPGVDLEEAVAALEQAKVLLIAGHNSPRELLKDPRQYKILKRYIDRGGFILAVGNCEADSEFDSGIRELARKMFTRRDDQGVVHVDAELKRLPRDHAVYRSAHPLGPHYEELQLWGVDYGCRTSMIYVPVQQNGAFDLSCLWDKWTLQGRNNPHQRFQRLLSLSLRLGENILAYATGREPPQKLQARDDPNRKGVADNIERGLLQVAKIIHTGDWDVAPRALRNLLIGLNAENGLTASTKQRNLRPADKNVFRYPVLYMHGRNRFSLSKTSRDKLRTYLTERGGLLFADACCGSREFDASFRELMKQLFPDKPFQQIPPTHELFTTKIGFDVKTVKRRMPESFNENAKLVAVTKEVKPFFEGIKIDGRYVVIYSKYDISCALERQASISCAGYVEQDAMKLGINILSYALLQDVRFSRFFE